ncbi:MAG TPA: hypothetical protein QGH10_14155 [Armatimonadota bacterium]|nr:hypothetical protein [Armatimonadota bacterium]
MRTKLIVVLGIILAVGLVGCKSTDTGAVPDLPQPAVDAPQPQADVAEIQGAPLGSIKVGDKAVCAVCAAEGGEHGVEEVKATLDYEGQTYAFCNEAEKAEFISDRTEGEEGGD